MWDERNDLSNASRDLKPGAFLTLDREWSGTQPIEIILTSRCRSGCARAINGAVSIQRGPVIFALPIDPEWKIFKDRPDLPFDDWEVYPKSPWNYALEIDREHPERSITFEDRASRAFLSSRRRAPHWWPRSKAGAFRAGNWRREPPLHRQKPRRQPRAARGTDAVPVRLHRPASHRVSNLGHSLSDRSSWVIQRCPTCLVSTGRSSQRMVVSIVWKLTVFVGVAGRAQLRLC